MKSFEIHLTGFSKGEKKKRVGGMERRRCEGMLAENAPHLMADTQPRIQNLS